MWERVLRAVYSCYFSQPLPPGRMSLSPDPASLCMPWPAIIDSGVAPSNAAESAIIATLPSGNAQYTVIVRGVGGATGVAVVQVYALN